MIEGIVYSSRGLWSAVKLPNGKMVEARLVGKQRLEERKLTNPLAVGDRVSISDQGKGDFLITQVLPRQNYLIRKSPRKTAHFHVIASNVDQAIIVFTLKKPRTSFGFLDRFLLCCEAYHIDPLILFHKSDLWSEHDKEFLHDVELLYRSLEYQTLNTSIEDKTSINKLKGLIEAKTSLIFGHSGSGKSTLLNLIDPTLDLRVNEISSFTNKGRHTTTFATMFDVGKEARVIDTPGVKEFGLDDTFEPYEIAHFFKDLKPFLGNCRFNNCLHIQEPNCGVIKAFEEGEIAPSRYHSYLSILEDDDFRDSS